MQRISALNIDYRDYWDKFLNRVSVHEGNKVYYIIFLAARNYFANWLDQWPDEITIFVKAFPKQGAARLVVPKSMNLNGRVGFRYHTY